MFDRTRVLIKLIDDYGWEQPHGVEVGVYKGKNAHALLNNIPNLNMTLIDPWDIDMYHGDQSGDCISEHDQQELNDIKQEAYERLSEFDSRITIYEADHKDADIDHPVHFAFLDGRHDYKGTIQQIAYWYNQVEDGGFLAGHDYEYPEYDFGVKQAVTDMSHLLNEDTELFDGYVWAWHK